MDEILCDVPRSSHAGLCVGKMGVVARVVMSQTACIAPKRHCSVKQKMFGNERTKCQLHLFIMLSSQMSFFANKCMNGLR